MKNKTLVIGCGRLGSNIGIFLSNLGEDVVILDKNEKSFNKINDVFNGYTIIGDATDIEYLSSQEYINNINKVIITTNDDNVNIFLADYFALIRNVKEIFVRINDVEKGELLNNLGIHIIYPFKLAFNDFETKAGTIK